MKTLLACVDFSSISESVVGWSTTHARETGARLLLLHVAPPDPAFVGYEVGPQTVRDQVASEYRDTRRTLQDWRERAESEGVESSALLVQGPTVEKILTLAEKEQVDLIVMGSHGHSALRQFLVGSVSEGVLRKTSCPVLIIPSPTT